MFEIHGWVSIEDSPGGEDDAAKQVAVGQVRERLAAAGQGSALRDLRAVNGQFQLHLGGMMNHRGPEADELFAFVEFVARVAPGSYGLVYFHDDEDAERQNQFRVLVVARGSVVERIDPFLSPLIPTVEDVDLGR